MILCLNCVGSPVWAFFPDKLTVSGPVELTAEEKAWLAKHKDKIRLAPTPDWEPMEIFERDGKYSGFVAEYMHLIENKLGFRFKLIRVESWTKVMELCRNRQVDVISAGASHPDRQLPVTWTEPYYKSPTTLICRKQLKGNIKVEKLLNSGMTVGICKDYAPYYYFKNKYNSGNITEIDTLLNGLKQLSFGEIDAIITELPHALYYTPRLHKKVEIGWD